MIRIFIATFDNTYNYLSKETLRSSCAQLTGTFSASDLHYSWKKIQNEHKKVFINFKNLEIITAALQRK
jgi:hypothetical protein